MVDYWVSHERHLCKYCNVWMQGDRLSIKHHEQGRRHKEKVEETFKQKRKAKSDAAASDRELQDQLRAIEEAAQAKYAQDMAAAGVPPPPPPRGRRPPPPPHRQGQSSGSNSRPRNEKWQDAAPQEEEEEPEEKEDDNGVYQVRGTVFLDGKKHENQLETGSACQIWVEEAEEWLDALIEKATVHTIPNTELSFRRFSVTYMLPSVQKPVTESSVPTDRLRIQMPAGMTLETAEQMVVKLQAGEATSAEDALREQVVIDETTGMGEWSTVEVRQIDESEEAVAQREAEAQAEAERLAEEEKRLNALEDFEAQGDDALGAFNPWGGSYKGVDLDAAANAPTHGESGADDVIHIRTNGDVAFKKRARIKGDGGDGTGTKAKKQKRRRIKSDDD